MPMAKNKPNTVARLAMGTAILTVISGCDNRIGQNISTAVAPVATAVTNAPVTVIQTLTPSTTAVIQPEYVTPGAPTYRETSRAANIQTFESVYGQPVAATPSDVMTASQTYAVPSYDDGAVTVQPLAAPVTNYTQQVMAATAPTYEAMPDSAAGFVYGETLTSESYTVVPEPVMMAAPAMAAPTMAAPIRYESETVFEGMAEPMPVDPFTTFAPVPVPAPVETYTIDSLPTYAPEAMVTEPAPLPQMVTDIFPQAYDETIPMMDASADMMPAAPSGFVVASEPMAEPMAFESTMDALPAMADPAPSYAGMQIIGNDEAEATYGIVPAPIAPATGSGSYVTLPYDAPAAPFEMAALDVTPMPSRKQVRRSVVPASINETQVVSGPLTAPVPRPRPARADASYAMLTTPLPQPRPAYDNPVAASTSSGEYVSIGALPGPNETNVMQAIESDLPVAPAPARRQETIETATLAAPTAEVEAEPTTEAEPSELSGTSWRLVEIDATEVAVNTELHFDGASGFAGGQGPCNSYGGEFVNTGAGRFSMANIFATDTSCSSIDIETRYLDALKKADAYEIAPGFAWMSLLDGDGQQIVRFKAF